MINSFKKDFLKFLDNIKINNSNIIVIQSQIFPILKFYDVKPALLLDSLYEIIIEKSNEITFLFPAFSNDFILKKKYDTFKSIPYTGLLPKYFVNKKHFRSESAIHGFVCVGPKIKKIKKLNQITTWGEGSIYEWLDLNQAVWVALNLDWNHGCALHHRAEELTKVPYRYFKTYEGRIYENDIFIKNFKEIKYSYSLKCIPIFNYDKWPKYLRDNDFETIKINEAFIAKVCASNIIIRRSCEFYNNDPFNSIVNKDEVKSWCINKKKNEIV